LEKNKKYVDKLNVVSIRLVDSPPLYSKKKLQSPEAVYQLLADEFSSLDREVIVVQLSRQKSKLFIMN